MKKKKASLFGVFVSVTNPKETLRIIEDSIVNMRRIYICVAAVHLIEECQYDGGLLEGVNRAGLVVPDGMPLVWLLRAAGFGDVRRVYGPDIMEQACRIASHKHFAVFILGGATGQSKEVKRSLKQQVPSLWVVGSRDTPHRPISDSENNAIVQCINKTNPAIVFIGMGCPWQEKWMIENRKKLKAPVLIGVGAAFDFITKKIPQAPRWIQNCGLEWFYRFIHEPKRLWRRYTVTNIKFALRLIRFWVGSYIGK